MPTFAYQDSGEYAMIMAAADKGFIGGGKAMLESLISLKRAGADAILAYFAARGARKLREMARGIRAARSSQSSAESLALTERNPPQIGNRFASDLCTKKSF
ncbi:MAG: hypothetical protein ACR2KT_00840 [Methylocella sp.]